MSKIVRLASKSCIAPKDHQAACRQAQDRSHLRNSWVLKKKVKCGRISIKVIAQEFLLCRYPVLEVEAMLAATFLKNLICAFSDRRLDDLLVSILAALDSDYPIVKTLMIELVHIEHTLAYSFVRLIREKPLELLKVGGGGIGDGAEFYSAFSPIYPLIALPGS